MNPLYYLKRIKQLGVTGILQTLNKQTLRKRFARTYKNKALNKQASHTWFDILQHTKPGIDFNDFFKLVKKNLTISLIYQSTLFQKHLPVFCKKKEDIIQRADKAVNNTFSLLGSPEHQSTPETIPWHHDFKSNESETFQKYASTFYQDISITLPETTSLHEYHPDIKVPWELSRLQHLFFLGKAYQLTHNQNYVKTFQAHVSDWIEKNPYLLGVNWVCPMDVAIRAINLIWGIHFFKNESSIPQAFWETLTCSLYDHALYLEYNWETSDKPNNHYLSDLLGYYYLCFFFEPFVHFKKQLEWCEKNLAEQLNKQLLDDGTCYEGSTAYHRLDTEIFLHFITLTKTKKTFPPNLEAKFNKAIAFFNNCTDQAGNVIQIGDNDSGKILTGLHHQSTNKPLITYENFGLSIIKHKQWHLSFRHTTSTQQQPTGHFHHDHLAITLTIDGQPILIDPGSYLYTANPMARNHFRSHQSHNTFFVEPCPSLEKEDLFQLPGTPHCQKPTINTKNDILSLQSSYIEKKQKITLHREIMIDKKKNECTIKDWVQKKPDKPIDISWTFLFHPTLDLKPLDNNQWLITSHNKAIAKVVSTLQLCKQDSFCSSEYGILHPCTKLSATKTYSKALPPIFTTVGTVQEVL